MNRIFLAAASGLFLVLAGAVHAQEIDAGLKAQLDQAGLSYEINDSGNVSVLISLKEGRTHTVYLMGKADTLGGLELREVWAVAGTFDSQPDGETLMNLLTEGGEQTVGAWNLEQTDDGWLAYYSAKLPTTLSGADLRAVVEMLAAVADAKEQELFSDDSGAPASS